MNLSLQGGLDRIIIFTRYPEVGKAKTRLIPKLGKAIATKLHRQLVEHTLDQSREWHTKYSYLSPSQEIIVCFTGGDPQVMAAWLGTDLAYQTQSEGDLGQKIINALQQLEQSALTQNLTQDLSQKLNRESTPEIVLNSNITNRSVIIGTDCPELNAKYLDQAFQLLEEKDLVLGPAEDGGYYLIGLKQVIPELFQGIFWSSDRVFAETVAIAKKLSLKVGYLPVLRDIDRPEDLIYLSTLANFQDLQNYLTN